MMTAGGDVDAAVHFGLWFEMALLSLMCIGREESSTRLIRVLSSVSIASRSCDDKPFRNKRAAMSRQMSLYWR